MSYHLESSAGTGLEIEDNTPSRILQDFIRDNWTNDTIPISDVDFGSIPDRTTKVLTVRVYPIIDFQRPDIGSTYFSFEVPVAIDVWCRDVSAQAERREPTLLVNMNTYLRDFISTNRLGLRSKGINNMTLEESRIIPDDPDDEQDTVWFHLVVQVRMKYYMKKVPD